MPIDPNAFRHHPGLAARIKDPETSFFRDLDLAEIDARMAERGQPPGWRRPDAEREALRHAFLDGHEGDLWVFAYGSLMWDPGIRFTEVRHAKLQGYSRALCLVDRRGARGSEDAPGVMAGLAPGGACDGLAFRVPEALVDDETERLWRREMIASAYFTVFAPAETAQGPITVLAFVADPDADMIETDLPPDVQARYVAGGEGFLGTSFEYLENMLGHLTELGIHDEALSDILSAARDTRAGGCSGVAGEGA